MKVREFRPEPVALLPVRRKRWNAAQLPVGGNVLAAVSQPATVSFSGTVVSPITGTLAAVSQAATFSSTAYAGAYPLVFPYLQPYLGPSSGATTGTLAAVSQAATVAFAGQNTPPPPNTGTLAAVSGSAVVTFAGQNTPPPITGVLGAVSGSATVAFSGLQSLGIVGSLSAASQPATVSFAGSVSTAIVGVLSAVSQPATVLFNGTWSGGSLPYSPPIPTPYRDDDAYDAIIALLLATNEFDGVVRSTDPDLARVTAEEARVIILDPGVGGSTSPQPSPYRLLRQPTYTLTIKVRAEEFEDSRAELDRLYAVVENTLLYQSYGGFTIPRLSTLYQDRYANAAHPEAQIQLRGQFGYIRVLPGGGFRTTY